MIRAAELSIDLSNSPANLEISSCNSSANLAIIPLDFKSDACDLPLVDVALASSESIALIARKEEEKKH